MTVTRAILSWPLRGIIIIYQMAISPFLPVSCRYAPTCSEYALEAIERHGPVKGLWLSLRRLGRCHPGGGHGYDPVPGQPNDKPAAATGTAPDFSR